MLKNLNFLTVLLFLTGLQSGCSVNKTSRSLDPAGLGPEGTQLKAPVQPATIQSNPKVWVAEQKLKAVITTGKRAIDWLNLVNLNRDLAHRLNLADITTKNPVPPEKPNVASIPLILEKFESRISELPPEMKPFLMDGKELVEIPPASDEIFLKTLREINKSYQAALRWIGHEPYLYYYSQNSVRDIRGYYFFKKEADVLSKLQNFDDQPLEKRELYVNWLTSLCHNSEISKLECLSELNTAAQDKKLASYYSKYLPQAESTYADFFKAETIRSDLKWNAENNLLTQDFVMPTIAKVSEWLKTNVEAEWKAVGFQLRLNYVDKNLVSPFMQFVKGVTPHVSGLRHEIITMDPDYSLDDYTTQWTIRHEFGHILGFPDCYLEFYDDAAETMTYYTIETDNLMCAWGGVLQPSHVEQLRKAYK